LFIKEPLLLDGCVLELLLEDLLEDVEQVVHDNRVLTYDATNNYQTTEILVMSVVTDEGLLLPYAVGEINLQVRYALM
jgi:uncharacterized membrane protein